MKRVTFFLIVIGIAIVAGCSDFSLTGEEPPIPIIHVGEDNIEVVRGSYCWKASCVDYAGPPELLEGKMPFHVQKGEKITIIFDYEPEPSTIELSRMLSTEKDHWITDQIDNGVFTVPNEEGVYYYSFLVHWYSEDGSYSEADSYYAFVVQVR